VSVWYKWSGVGTDWQRNYGLWIHPSGHYLFQMYGGGGSAHLVTGVRPDTEWHHLVGTYDGSRVRLYLDGVNVVDAPGGGVPHQTAQPVTIGGWDAWYHQKFNGLVDEIALFDRTLDGSEVVELAEGVDSGPIALTIDVKPGSDRNPINLKGKGVIPVAILTTDDFDAATVDGAAVRFAGAEAVHGGHVEDVDGDGAADWIGHFNTQDAKAALQGETEATLVIIEDGDVVAEGSDAVDTGIGKGRGSGKAAASIEASSWGEIKRQAR